MSDEMKSPPSIATRMSFGQFDTTIPLDAVREGDEHEQASSSSRQSFPPTYSLSSAGPGGPSVRAGGHSSNPMPVSASTAKPLIQKVNKFSGEVSEDVDNWVLHFTDTIEANEWDAMYCLRLLPSCLMGAASQWWHAEAKSDVTPRLYINHGDGSQTLKDLLKMLVIRFGDPEKRENARI